MTIDDDDGNDDGDDYGDDDGDDDGDDYGDDDGNDDGDDDNIDDDDDNDDGNQYLYCVQMIFILVQHRHTVVMVKIVFSILKPCHVNSDNWYHPSKMDHPETNV